MAALQSRSTLLPSLSSSSSSSLISRRPHASLHAFIFSRLSTSKPQPISMNVQNSIQSSTLDAKKAIVMPPTLVAEEDNMIKSKLYAIAEAAADRATMHAIIGEQRDNWNTLLLNSINSITLAASVSTGLSAMATGASPHVLAFKISSVVLYAAATVLSLAINYLQPSQLAEEQRNAARLFKQLEKRVQTILALRHPSESDVEDAMERVLSIDKAYPLALLSVMLEKFPDTVKPAVWWPEHHDHQRQRKNGKMATSMNGWSKAVEAEVKGVLETLKEKDTPEFLRLGEIVLNVNKILATSGPVLTGIAAMAAAGSGTWPTVIGVLGGALATVVNTLEHGGQVGMVFEMYRNSAGYYRQLEEEIESNLERDVGKRENGEMLQMKMALKLGRSVPDLKSLEEDGDEEFAGKLF